jgi:hypothetical protein
MLASKIADLVFFFPFRFKDYQMMDITLNEVKENTSF